MSLFEKKDWIMHSGEKSDFKLECDALTDEDLETLAYLISKKFTFFDVRGVPTGGMRLANKLAKYIKGGDKFLIVDDVLTTGKSMEKARSPYFRQYRDKIIGIVIFARGECPDWVRPIFDMSKWEE